MTGVSVGERILLDPTGEQSIPERKRSPRPAGLQGLRLAFLDISKPRGNVFLDRLAEALGERGAIVKRYRKPTFTKPAPLDLRQQIAQECSAVVEALAD